MMTDNLTRNQRLLDLSKLVTRLRFRAFGGPTVPIAPMHYDVVSRPTRRR